MRSPYQVELGRRRCARTEREAWRKKFSELDEPASDNPGPDFGPYDTNLFVGSITGSHIREFPAGELVSEDVDGQQRWYFRSGESSSPHHTELTEDQAQRVAAHSEWAETVRRRGVMESTAEEYARGDVPVWRVSADPVELSGAGIALRQAEREEWTADAAAKDAEERRNAALGALKGVETGDFSDCPETVTYLDGRGQEQTISREEFEGLVAYTSGLSARGRDGFAEASADAGRSLSPGLRAERAGIDADSDVKRRREIVGYLEYAETNEQIVIDEAERARRRLRQAQQQWLQTGWDGPLPKLAD